MRKISRNFKPLLLLPVKQLEMKSEKDIIESIGKPYMGVPEGYFNDLKDRLGAISHAKTVEPALWMRLRPYVAMAASFAAILLIGNAVLRNTLSGGQAEDTIYSEPTYADMISLTHPEAVYQVLEYGHEDLSDEDIINYLIESGTEMEYLAYSGNQKY